MAAQALEARYQQSFTRQQIYAWHRRAELNGFPAQVDVKGRDGKTRKLLDLAKVVRWYATYRPNLGGRPMNALPPEDLEKRAIERSHCPECQQGPGEECRDQAGYSTATHAVRLTQIKVVAAVK